MSQVFSCLSNASLVAPTLSPMASIVSANIFPPLPVRAITPRIPRIFGTSFAISSLLPPVASSKNSSAPDKPSASSIAEPDAYPASKRASVISCDGLIKAFTMALSCVVASDELIPCFVIVARPLDNSSRLRPIDENNGIDWPIVDANSSPVILPSFIVVKNISLASVEV